MKRCHQSPCGRKKKDKIWTQPLLPIRVHALETHMGQLRKLLGTSFLCDGFSVLERLCCLMKGKLHSEHFLGIFQIKVSHPEQSDSLEISAWVVHRTDVTFAYVQMIFRIAGAQWEVFPVIKGFAEGGVEVLEVKGKACVGVSSLTFPLLMLCLFQTGLCWMPASSA